MIQKLCLSFFLAAVAPVAAAQIAAPTTDVLGAHLNYGRGCVACHSPHSGSAGNGSARTAGSAPGNVALWGEDVSSLLGKTLVTGGGACVETLPTSMSANTPDVAGMLTCLSCHDGNYASSAMMKNKVYEKLPSSYGAAATVPTLIGNNGNYLSEHPVGLSATIRCGGDSAWDCTAANGVVRMTGPASSRFVSSYGFFMKPANYNNTPVVVCTTCHEPHVMNAVTITRGSTSGLPAGTYATMFFLRAPYNPSDPNPESNQTAQFCRQCHADKSNEANGSTARTVF